MRLNSRIPLRSIQATLKNNPATDDDRTLLIAPILFCIRNFYARYDYLPDMRIFVKALRLELGEEKGSTPYLYRLFREAPLKLACKIGGLPKPSSCI